MSRNALCLTVLTILAALRGRAAEAQIFLPIQTSFGSTILGDGLRGWGAASVGMGLYNLNTAAARSIEADTWMRLNQYHYEAFLEQKRRLAALEAHRKARQLDTRKEIETRLVDHPEPRDIYRGDSLNALARIVAAMNAHPSVSRTTGVSIPGGTLQSIPLVYGPTHAVISLARLDVKDRWPLLLQLPIFTMARQRCEAALDSVQLDLLDRRLSSRTLEQLDRSVEALGTESWPLQTAANPTEARQARAFLAELCQTTEMLRDPQVVNAFADVMGYMGTSAADLLAFLARRDLRFAPAADPHEKELLEDVYALLTEHRAKLKTMVGSE
jgi:hypothetical protein